MGTCARARYKETPTRHRLTDEGIKKLYAYEYRRRHTHKRAHTYTRHLYLYIIYIYRVPTVDRDCVPLDTRYADKELLK